MKQSRYTSRFSLLFFVGFFFLTVPNTLSADTPQKKGIRSINRNTAEAYVDFLAADELEGRNAGSRSGRVAGLYIASQLKRMGIEPLFPSYFEPFQIVQIKSNEAKKRYQLFSDTIHAEQINGTALSLNNILGKIIGKRANEYVIIGAHYDHLGIDGTLTEDSIFNGADDNASGVSAVLQIAQAFLATGLQPERTVIFALWDGEEKGLLGSRYFTSHFSGIDQVKGYLNFDMIGRNQNEEKPNHVVFFYTEAHPAFEKWLTSDIETHKFQLEPNIRPWERPTGGSDNASFAKLDIPVIWYHTDGHPDYHQPGDETDKINWDKLLDITRAAFLNFWNLANEENF